MTACADTLHGFVVERFDEIDSTSLRARRDLAAGRGVGRRRVLVAATQTGGVGRFGRRYACPRGGLWCTVVAPLEGERPSALEGLGLRIGLAVLRAVDTALSVDGAERVRFKWPNDVYVDGRKVAGVLTEVVDAGGVRHVLVGAGVNADFAAADLPAGVRESAATLREATGAPVDVGALLSSLVSRLAGAVTAHEPVSNTVGALRPRLHGVGDPAGVMMPDGSTRHGELLGLTDDGRLQLRLPGGEFTAPHGAALVV